MAHRALFIDHAAGIGGAQRSLLLLLQRLRRGGTEAHLAGTPGRLLDEAARLGVAAHPLPLRRLRGQRRSLLHWASGIAALTRLAQRLDVTLLYANTVRSVCYALPAALITRRPLVWHVRDYSLRETPGQQSVLDRVLRILISRAADRVIANSRAVAASLPRRARVVVVHNGIETERFNPGLDGGAFRRQFGIPQDAPLVGMVARLRPWKGGDRFVRMAHKVGQQIPSARFVMVGGDPFALPSDYAGSLRRMSSELGMSDRLVFTGHVDDVRRVLAALDVFVHPGDPEPFGLAVVEAMATAKPVVGFAHGALPEIVSAGETGLLVSPLDEDALAGAVAALLRHPARRRRLGQAGRVRAHTRFHVERTLAEVTKAIEDLSPAAVPGSPRAQARE